VILCAFDNGRALSVIRGRSYIPDTLALSPVQATTPLTLVSDSVRTKLAGLLVGLWADWLDHVPATLSGADPGPVEHATQTPASAMTSLIFTLTRAKDPSSPARPRRRS
jgi:hypothetical protein